MGADIEKLRQPAIRLYRFMRAEYALQSLELKRMRVSQFSSLNDPFDCCPAITDYSDYACPECGATNNLLGGVIEAWNRRFGLISFSTDYSNPLLWSHYADSHRGMAFIFNLATNWPEPRYVQVSYSERRPQVPFAKLDSDPGEWDDVLKNVFSVKAESWAYEKEYRIYPLLSDCWQADGAYYTKLPSISILGVILGSRCSISPNYVHDLLAQCGCKKSIVLRAKPSSEKFEVEIWDEPLYWWPGSGCKSPKRLTVKEIERIF